MSSLRCFRACAIAVLTPLVAIGSDLHVALPPVGNNANPGTLALPLATIAYAETLAVAGDTIHLHQGVYRESVLFRESGSAAAPITYQSYDDGSGPDEVIISGFELIQPGQNGVGQWQQHQGSIYKIQLSSNHALAVGDSTVLVNSSAQKIARWPNAPQAFDFDWEIMASPEGASLDVNSAGPHPPFSGTFHTATYNDSELPYAADNQWVGARIDTSPANGVFQTTGQVTASDEESITFRYRRDETQTVTIGDPYFLWNTLAALDEEGEYFFDLEGLSGPAYTLYLWAPGGASPESLTVELKCRDYCFDLNWTDHININNLTFLGGGITCPPSTSNISLNGLTLRYCGSGLDLLKTGRAGIWLKGDAHSVRDCTLESSYGGGVLTLGTNTEITNNVVRDCMLYSIATWDSSNIDVSRNTTYRNGGENITMFSPGSVFSYNHCYHGGMRVTDSASMNSHYNGDLLGMEVAYNWVHSNVARRDATYGWGGGRGIRMDTSPSNVYIHHNMIWNISAPVFSMVLWSLDENQHNYQNSQIRAYNNTIDGEINIPGSGSMGGHDIRNNISTEVREYGVDLDQHTVRSNYFTIGKFEDRWEGNATSSGVFLSAPTGDFELKPESPAIDAGEVIPGITDGFSGSAPDAGALEYNPGSNPHWSAGALLRARDAANLKFVHLAKQTGDRYLVLSGMPAGRIPAQEFKVRLGGSTILSDFRLVYSTETHTGEAYLKIEDSNLTGVMALEFALDGVNFQSNGDLVDLSGTGLQIDSIDITSTSPAGGSTHTISGKGFGSSLWMVPLQIVNATGDDLNLVPVPVVFNSRDHISQGRMNPDCSDLRVVHWETNRELQHYIESGKNTDTTLLWVKYTADSPLPKRFSQIDESTYYLTFGDPNRPSTADSAVLFDHFSELASPDLEVWASANELAEQTDDGEKFASWNNAAGAPLVQESVPVQPVLELDQLNGFPAVSFDGSNFLNITGFPGSIQDGYTVFAVLKTEPGHDSQGRLVSVGNGPSEATYVRPGTRPDWTVLGLKRAYTGDVTNIGVGRRFLGNSVFLTGKVAELLVFSNLLTDSTGSGMDRMQQYLNRKYGMDTSVQGLIAPNTVIAPTRFYLGNQALESVTVIDDNTAVFTAPPVDTQNQPVSFVLSAARGYETAAAPASLVYFTPAYDQWSLTLPAGSRDEHADPDEDGTSNLMEFATASNALAPDIVSLVPIPTGDPDSPLPPFQFYRNPAATDVLLSVDYSQDLQTWQTLSLSHPNITVVDPDPFGDGSSVLHEISPVDPLASRGYYRLKAERVGP